MKQLSVAKWIQVLATALVPFALGAYSVGPATLLRASLWTLAQLSIASLLSTTLGLAALFAAKPGVLVHLDRFVARGFELAAALPVVLATALLAALLPWPVSIATAIVVGLLDGLQCIREVATSLPQLPVAARGAGRQLLRSTVRKSLVIVFPTLIERIVMLDAALAWLELFPRLGAGAWGEGLGQAARQGDLMGLLTWTLIATGWSATVKIVFPLFTEVGG
jgi:hypothetical protein